jgi:hypothetical protein
MNNKQQWLHVVDVFDIVCFFVLLFFRNLMLPIICYPNAMNTTISLFVETAPRQECNMDSLSFANM